MAQPLSLMPFNTNTDIVPLTLRDTMFKKCFRKYDHVQYMQLGRSLSSGLFVQVRPVRNAVIVSCHGYGVYTIRFEDGYTQVASNMELHLPDTSLVHHKYSAGDKLFFFGNNKETIYSLTNDLHNEPSYFIENGGHLIHRYERDLSLHPMPIQAEVWEIPNSPGHVQDYDINMHTGYGWPFL